MSIRDGGMPENLGPGGQIEFAGHNLLPLVEIGLIDVPQPAILRILRYSVVDTETLDSKVLQIEDNLLILSSL